MVLVISALTLRVLCRIGSSHCLWSSKNQAKQNLYHGCTAGSTLLQYKVGLDFRMLYLLQIKYQVLRTSYKITEILQDYIRKDSQIIVRDLPI